VSCEVTSGWTPGASPDISLGERTSARVMYMTCHRNMTGTQRYTMSKPPMNGHLAATDTYERDTALALASFWGCGYFRTLAAE
jgi:hypothetical protein